MSIEYTIDIQLTELGFPDLVETPGTAGGPAEGRPTTRNKKLPAGRTSGTLSHARRRNTSTANQSAVEAKDVEQQTANAEPQSSVSSVKTVTGRDDEEEEEGSEDSDVSMVGDEEEDDYEEEVVDEEEFDGMALLTLMFKHCRRRWVCRRSHNNPVCSSPSVSNSVHQCC